MHCLVSIDEGLLMYREGRRDTISGTSPLSTAQGMARSSKVGFAVSTNAIRQTDEPLRTNSYTLIAFRPNDARDAKELQRAMHLTDAEAAFSLALPDGHVLLKCGRLPYAIHARFDPVPASVDAQRYERIVALTHAYLRSMATSFAASPAVAARPAVDPLREEPRSVLSVRAHKFLTYLCGRGVALVTETYEALDLQPEQGNRVRKQLSNYGLIRQDRILVRTGVGRHEGTALMPTSTAYEYLKIQRPRVGRGGAAHAWYVRTLADLIPRARVESNGADVVIIVGNDHTHLIDVLRDLGCHLLPNTGDPIAIEVECSKPSATADRNIARNTSNNAITITAVLPDHLRSTRKRLENVVDVLALIERLRA